MFGANRARLAASAVLCAGALALAAPNADAQATTTTAPYGAAPRAYIVVDQATGAVLSASNERTPLPPASLTKVVTALAAVAALGPTATVPVSDRAAGMPAHKLNMKVGEVWPVGDVLSSLLASSANDAAAALAERVGGTLENFHVALSDVATHLQMADAPTLQDPAGLDDNFSVRGGNLISARDLAIAARAVLGEPRLAPIVARPVTEFTDPNGVLHRLVNHNKLLTRYAGAVGMKTGYTHKAGRGLIAAATRNGRTEVAVVLDAVDTYGWAGQLLDAAFAAPVPPNGDRLPAIAPKLHIKAAKVVSITGAPAAAVTSQPAARTRDAAGLPLLVRVTLFAVGLLAATWCVLRGRVLVRRHRRRRRRATARVRRQVNRRRDPELTPHYKPHSDHADRFHEAARR
jgi:D-alanyl-D-alanine carboxypeptidase